MVHKMTIPQETLLLHSSIISSRVVDCVRRSCYSEPIGRCASCLLSPANVALLLAEPPFSSCSFKNMAQTSVGVGVSLYVCANGTNERDGFVTLVTSSVTNSRHSILKDRLSCSSSKEKIAKKERTRKHLGIFPSRTRGRVSWLTSLAHLLIFDG